MYVVEIWDEQDYEDKEKGAFVNGVEVLLDSEKELKVLINILLQSPNVFTVKRTSATLVRE